MKRRLIAVFGLIALVLSTVSAAYGIPNPRRGLQREWGVDDVNRALERADKQAVAPDDQHGVAGEHLPGRVRNVRRISRLRLTDIEGGIADVAYYKGFAYLNKWHPHCGEAGTEVVDVRRPARPRNVAFLPAGPNDYTTEGAHAFTMRTRFFSGDVYVVSHESCNDLGLGGISLWDVSDPRNPWPLVRHFGDRTFGGDAWAHDSHSAMGWSAGNKSYVVAVDNLGLTESAQNPPLGGDVDIFDVTNPANPRQIADFSLIHPADMMPEAQDNLANGANANHHDMWVRRIDGDGDGDRERILMLSYWDAGWIKIDVSDPANPTYIDDSDYPAQDAETVGLPGGPFTHEGNAHQGEWSQNRRWWLGTDEDFAPYRAQFTTDDDATFDGSEFSWTPPVSETYEDGQVNGPVVWGGLACDDPSDGTTPGSVPDAAAYEDQRGEGEELILVVSRGGCFFSWKVHNAQNMGWDAAIIGQSHAGTLNGLNPDAFICGSQGHDFEPQIVALCTGHRAMHEFFDDTPAYEGADGADMPLMGTVGDDVTARADIFDGWGYLNLLNARTLNHVDTFAPRQVHNEGCASGCGTMSVHEIATDKRPGNNLGYLAWYGLGLRVVEFGRDGITQKGVYMDVAGNDFWGVEVMKRGNRRPLILMSDRDSGLWIFKYTGRE